MQDENWDRMAQRLAALERRQTQLATVFHAERKFVPQSFSIKPPPPPVTEIREMPQTSVAVRPISYRFDIVRDEDGNMTAIIARPIEA